MSPIGSAPLPATRVKQKHGLFRVLEYSVIVLIGAALVSACEQERSPPEAWSNFSSREYTTELCRIRVSRVVDGLEHPWGLAFLPDGRYLVTERAGRLDVIDAEGRVTRILGVPKSVYRYQGGLLDVVLHPDFATNRWVYLTYSRGNWRRSESWLTLVRGRLDGNRLTDVERLFSQNQSNFPGVQYGGRMAWLGDGTLLLSVGDRRTQLSLVQDTAYHTGKILRLNDDGTAPRDNPFVGKPNALPEIYSVGHRNPQGLVVDPDGRIWETEHGPKGGDELNLIRPGVNYGWPIVSLGRDYETDQPFGQARSLPGFRDPVIELKSRIAPSGLERVYSEQFASWRGNLLVGGMRVMQLRRLVLEGENVVHEEILLENEIGRVRTVREGPDGQIYLLTDHDDGALYRVEVVQ